MKPENTPIVLFGAFDRHNLGDLLFPHVAASLLGIERELVFAGIAERDMGLFGGHRVVSLDRWREAHGRPFDLVHVGGEIFTCDAWEGAVMVLAPDDAQRAIAAYDTDEIGRMVWAKQQLGISRLAPYVAANGRGKSIFCGVGGVELSRRSIVFQE